MNSSSCFTHSLHLFFFLFLSNNNIIPLEVGAAPAYLNHICPNTTLIFTPNSTYQNNLKTVLSSLSSSSTSAAVAASGYSTSTSGSGPPDKAYGLFVCRGDLSVTTCSVCVATATQEILQRCPNQKVSMIWYDQCMLRYSNQSIFSIMVLEPTYIYAEDKIVTDVIHFSQALSDAFDEAASQASRGILKKFGAAQASFTSSQKLYVFTQCTPDLSSSECNLCLKFLVGRFAPENQHGQALTPSCQARFEFYLFYNASTLGPKGQSNYSTAIIIAIILLAALVVVLFFLACWLLRKRAKKTYEAAQGDESGVTEVPDVQSLQFDLASIQAATDNFSQRSKLGHGGFGEVFQGRLTTGQDVAVKRLSQSSGQGAEDFKNEVVLVAKLQHKNLVRLLGFCLEGQEKLLIYEFVPNGSLDHFLFDTKKCKELDWLRRYKIIVGVARGMLYLHEDSCLRIIHRDLKASNILLDSDMKPKISDFGTARIFGVEQSQANTRKIVGTFGYMPPEYVLRGQFSVKSDVYSFGILLLEIISGKRNGSFYEADEGGSLASYAWKHWKHGTPLEVLDRSIGESYSRNEVVRCLHISLLCVQEDPADRPTMASIVLMLSSYLVTPPMPQEPAFFLQRRTNSGTLLLSANEVSITEVCPR